MRYSLGGTHGDPVSESGTSKAHLFGHAFSTGRLRYSGAEIRMWKKRFRTQILAFTATLRKKRIFFSQGGSESITCGSDADLAEADCCCPRTGHFHLWVSGRLVLGTLGSVVSTLLDFQFGSLDFSGYLIPPFSDGTLIPSPRPWAAMTNSGALSTVSSNT